MNFEITGVSNEISKQIKEFVHTDMWNYMSDISLQNMSDYLIYGYNPWDYVKELELNMKHQNLK